MSFPTDPKDGLVHKHKNGYSYVFNADSCSWDIIHDDIVPVVGPVPRKTRKAPRALKEAQPTINIDALTIGVSDELS